MRDILRNHSLIGHHCTKLTVAEIEDVRSNGMTLQNATSLNSRISSLQEMGEITADIAQLLKSRNQADDSNRANMLWFCFFEPFLAGRCGIERFFRSWGGEALYNSHEDEPVTSNALLSIGTPCIIRAKVSIASLAESYYPDSSMIRAFLSQRGHRLDNEIRHEGYSTESIRAQNIIEIIEHPDDSFFKLTKCHEWEASGEAL